jgi:hypothetical protein
MALRQAMRMILVFEMTWTGTQHAPGNSVTIQTVARSAPEQAIRVFADASHLTELARDAALLALDKVTLRPIAVSPHYRHKTHIVSLRRGAREFATMWAALRDAPRDEACLLFLISATPTAVIAASWLARLSRRVAGVQVGLHGNLNDLTAWRSRNPLRRRFDLPATLGSRRHRRLRFLVLEDAIKRALRTLAPNAVAVTDVLPLPVNLAEVTRASPPSPTLPLRIGLVGQATDAKGIGPFLTLARALKARHGNKLAFEVVGRAPPGSDLGRFAVLDEPVTHDHLPREAFCARLARLHYVCLPLQPGYYNLSASGALIDAITWLIPVLASRVPITEDAFARFGDIGYLCEDADAMNAVIETLLERPDPERYSRQVSALRRARDARMPDALANDYRNILLHGFPGLLPDRRPGAATAMEVRARG